MTTKPTQNKVNLAQERSKKKSNVPFAQVSMITMNVGIRPLETRGTITTIMSETDSQKTWASTIEGKITAITTEGM